MSIEYPNIMTECNVDTNVVSYLMNGTVNHQKGCGNVANILEHNFPDKFAIGIIDNDRIKIPYLDKCKEITSSSHLHVLRHCTYPHYIIVVGEKDKAMDRFIWDCAKEQKINLGDHNLPSDFDAFKDRMKKKTSNNDPDVRSLVIAISCNKEVDTLRKLLKYLKDKLYQSKQEDIINLFEKSAE